MTNKPILVDELLRGDHSYINDDDLCYFIMVYTSRVGFGHSPENSLISNFKKTLDKQGKAEWQYKIRAINEIGNILKSMLPKVADLNNTTIVPIPPSKTINNPLYDDRLNKVLAIAGRGKAVDIRNLLINVNDVEATHTISDKPRPTIDEIKENLQIDETLINNLKPKILLFDDVLTSGAHYIAAKQVIEERFPDASVYGFFIARRELPPVTDFDDIFPDFDF